ncbi:AraC family transcriptional regulator [Paludibacter sp.]|uniref:AraC family transcriptional regulator n=1 Tax=Paludibacter sp. TaxID=1898105 RepID=UPI0025F77B1C|nr:AraC family transcriptional regulator [Paludibacter sp.]
MQNLLVVIFVFILISGFGIYKLLINSESVFSPAIDKSIALFYKENQNQQVLEELKKVEHEKPDKTNMIMCQILKAAAYCEMKELENASHILNSIDIKEIKDDPRLQFWYTSVRGLILFRMEKYSAAYKELTQTLHGPFSEERGLALNKRILGRLCFESKAYKQAIDWLVQSSQHFLRAGLIKGIGINERIIARYYFRNGNLPEAFIHFTRSETELKKSDDKEELFYLYIDWIDFYVKKQDFDEALRYASLAFQNSLKLKNNSLVALALNNYGEIEIHRNRFDNAIGYLRKALVYYPDYRSQRGRIIASLDLSQAHAGLSQMNEALKYAQQAVYFVANSGQMQLQENAFEALAHLHEKLHNDHLAFCYLDSAMQLKDCSNSYVSDLNKAYQYSKAGLDSMTFKVMTLQQSRKKQLMIELQILAVLLIIITLLFVTFRLVKKKNAALVKKNMELLEERKHYSALLQQNMAIKKKNRNETDCEKLDLLYGNLIKWLEEDKRFTQSDISLDVASKELNTNRDYLSKAINERFGRFTDLVNKYRIEEAISLLSDSQKKTSQYKLSIIAAQVGFNSSSAFIEAFKKQTHLTPVQFRKNITQSL